MPTDFEENIGYNTINNWKKKEIEERILECVPVKLSTETITSLISSGTFET